MKEIIVQVLFYLQQEYLSILFKLRKKIIYPDFRKITNIFYIFFITYIYYFCFYLVKEHNAIDFKNSVIDNFLLFNCFLFIQIILLIIISFFINKINAILGFITIILTNVFTNILVYLIMYGCIINETLMDKFLFLTISTIIVSVAFLLFFDWKYKSYLPLDDISKMNIMQSKMDPHFFFNALNSCLYLIKTDPNLAEKIIINLSSLFRENLKNKDFINLIPLSDELNIINKYLEIEKIRLGDKLNIDIKVSNDNDILSYKLPQLLIESLVENSVYHGVQSLVEPSTIFIEIKKTKTNQLNIIISNKYDRSNNKFIKQSNKSTLILIEEKLNIIYAGRASFNIDDDGENFTVNLLIPKNADKIIELFNNKSRLYQL